MQHKTLKKLLLASTAATAIAAIFIISIIIHVRTAYTDQIFPAAEVAPAQAIVILGASLKEDDSPSAALEDRLIRGAELYSIGKAPKILVTGDNGQNHTDEVSVMKNYLLDLNIPEQDIVVDNHGYRTYESCKRAKAEFDVSQAILVTQEFHLVRALYICNTLGVKSTGVTADLREYKGITKFTARDWLASFKAWIDLNLIQPKPPISYSE